MASSNSTNSRWQTDGKFFRCGSDRIHPRMVTYGPLPGGWPNCFREDFKRIAAASFDAIRIYELPCPRMLESAADCGLKVFAGLSWQQDSDFISHASRLSAARIELAEWLTQHGDEPGLAGVFVGNEIPADLVRWMGPLKVQNALEDLIALGRQIAPHLLYAYANFPSTEYLEPGNADFTAFNIYLEQEDRLTRYLRRLHHVAGDRPLVVSEFGLDTQRHGEARQAELLQNAIAICEAEAVAGFTVFTWSDRWLSGGLEVDDWSFGLVDRDGKDKAALKAMREIKRTDAMIPIHSPKPAITAIVCTRNGRGRISTCLEALLGSDCSADFEVMVVDDGSTDGTSDFIRAHYPQVELVRIEAGGLSVARNIGAQLAKADILAYTDDDCEPDREWLQRVLQFLQSHPDHAAVGGPNLPQRPQHWREAVVCAAPGAPSHVMLDDLTAEHLPGCNLVVRKSALEQVEGFDPRFHAAGDDVDFCWRLQNRDLTLGFDAGAFVRHWRRPSLRSYLRQQLGYGRAERMLIAKHPQRFGKSGTALWEGMIYTGAPLRVSRHAIIYHGSVNEGAYHPQLVAVQPQRDIAEGFDDWKSQLTLKLISWLAPALRAWHRNRRLLSLMPSLPRLPKLHTHANPEQWHIDGVERDVLIGKLLELGWKSSTDGEYWDLKKEATQVMLATEKGDKGAMRTLVRVAGDSSLLHGDLAGFWVVIRTA